MLKYIRNFFLTERPSWGQYQYEVSEALGSFLASGKDFSIEIGFTDKKKTKNQLAGIYRIVDLYAIRLTEKQNEIISKESAKIALKYKFGITRLANYNEAFVEALRYRREKEALGVKMTINDFNYLVKNLQKTLQVPASFASITKDQATKLLEDIHELFVAGMGWREMELLPEELRSIEAFYNNPRG